MPCIVRDPESGRTNIKAGFDRNAIKVKIYEGHDGEEAITHDDARWVKLSATPVLAVSKIKIINGVKTAPVRVYFRDEERAQGIVTHAITVAGNNIVAVPDSNQPNKFSDGGFLVNNLMAAYLSSGAPAEYFDVSQDAVDAEVQRFSEDYLGEEEDIIHFPEETLELMREKIAEFKGEE